MSIIKKCLGIFLISYFMFYMLLFTTFAADNIYYLDELGMDISIPTDYIVLTRDIKEDAWELEALGISKEAMMQAMEEEGIYLEAFKGDMSHKITVWMKNGLQDVNYNILSDDEIEEYIEDLRKNSEFDDLEFYRHKQMKFIKGSSSLYTPEGIEVYRTGYYTVYNNKLISIEYISYGKKANFYEEAAFEEIIGGINFNMELDSKSHMDNLNTAYINNNSGISSVIISLIITAVLYMLFPIIFANLREKKVSKRRYRIYCYIFNFFMSIIVNLLNIRNMTGYSITPYIFWTMIFSYFGIKVMRKRNILAGEENIKDNIEENNIIEGEDIRNIKFTQEDDGIIGNVEPTQEDDGIIGNIEPTQEDDGIIKNIEFIERDNKTIDIREDTVLSTKTKNRYCKSCGFLLLENSKGCCDICGTKVDN